MTMPEPANSAPFGIKEAGTAPAVVPVAGDGPPPNDLADYVTPPPKKVIAVAVRYGEARKGAPMPYELPGADEEP
jgi:hypothetical protein